jgi:hypothetical protein
MTRHGRLEGDHGRFIVRCFSEDGRHQRDFDFSGLTAAEELRDALVAAFSKRTAPGEGLTSLESMQRPYNVVVQFDRYLATSRWPPKMPCHLTREHYDGFYDTRKHIGSVHSDALAGTEADAAKVRPIPRRRAPEGRSRST